MQKDKGIPRLKSGPSLAASTQEGQPCSGRPFLHTVMSTQSSSTVHDVRPKPAFKWSGGWNALVPSWGSRGWSARYHTRSLSSTTTRESDATQAKACKAPAASSTTCGYSSYLTGSLCAHRWGCGQLAPGYVCWAGHCRAHSWACESLAGSGGGGSEGVAWMGASVYVCGRTYLLSPQP